MSAYPPKTTDLDDLSWLDEDIERVDAEVAKRALQDAKYDWVKTARPDQLPPDWDWVYWLILAGRGYGKTRTGAETVREWVKKYEYVNLIGATSDDARDIMIEGESGILAVCPKDERPTYLAHKRQLRWPNGAKSLIFTADEPDRLRGKQHMKLWCDELCAWRYQESWDQAKFGLRLGDAPQAVLTTTPRPTKLLKQIMNDKRTALTRGRTIDNKANLAPAFLEAITARYEGTRLGRQELNAEVLEDNPGALWKRELIDATRVPLDKLPAMRRIVVGVDPSATANKDSDECGILVVGLGVDGRGYVLEDGSGVMTPDEWGKRAVALYRKWSADRIVAETNNGGLMVENTIRTVDRNVPYKGVHAAKGKMTRAEPVSALYEQGKVSHVGLFNQLEDQMCFPAGTMVETQRGPVAIQDVATTDSVLTRSGYAPIDWVGITGETDKINCVLYSHDVVLSTPCHPIYSVSQSKFVPAQSVLRGESLLALRRGTSGATGPSRGEGDGTGETRGGTSGTPRENCSAALSTRRTTGLSLRAIRSITRTRIPATTRLTILRRLLASSTTRSTGRAVGTLSRLLSGRSAARRVGPTENLGLASAGNAEHGTPQSGCGRASTAPVLVNITVRSAEPIQVYNLRVKDGYEHEFYANGVLVHNCEYDQKTSKYSPDRMDALVWALTELMVEPLPGQGYIDLYKQRADEARARKAGAPDAAPGEPQLGAPPSPVAKAKFCVVTTNH